MAYKAMNGRMTVDDELGSGKKCLLPILRYYSSICLVDHRKKT
jgi:hypothetical protein